MTKGIPINVKDNAVRLRVSHAFILKNQFFDRSPTTDAAQLSELKAWGGVFPRARGSEIDRWVIFVSFLDPKLTDADEQTQSESATAFVGPLIDGNGSGALPCSRRKALR